MPNLPMDHEDRYGGGGGGGGGGVGSGVLGIRNLLNQGYTLEEIQNLLAGMNGSGSGVSALQPINLSAFTPQGFGGGSRESAEARLLQLAGSIAQLEAGQRNALFSALFPALLPFLQNGGEGFSEEALAGMRSQAIEGTAGQFGNARSALATELSRRGLRTGSNPISGEGLRRTAELGATEARSTSDALRDVLLKNESQRLSNLFSAGNLASGNPSNPSAAIQAAGSIPEARPGLGSTVVSSLAGAGASALGTALGNALSRIPIFRPPTVPCAVAIALYGENDIRVLILRLWLVFHVDRGPFGWLVDLYRKYGTQLAAIVQRNRLAHRIAETIFSRLVQRAVRWMTHA